MSDANYDPYAGAETEEERQTIYQKLLSDYETAEYERRKGVYDDLMADWKHHRSIQQDIDQRSHKALLTIAAGSFGVSFAFISQIVQLDAAVHLSILIISWASFAAAILTLILELKIGSLVQDLLLDNTEENIRRGYEGKPYIEPKKWLVRWPSRILSWLSIITFSAGIVCLLFFVLLNMKSM